VCGIFEFIGLAVYLPAAVPQRARESFANDEAQTPPGGAQNGAVQPDYK
jgi:hypothetical protein